MKRGLPARDGQQVGDNVYTRNDGDVQCAMATNTVFVNCGGGAQIGTAVGKLESARLVEKRSQTAGLFVAHTWREH